MTNKQEFCRKDKIRQCQVEIGLWFGINEDARPKPATKSYRMQAYPCFKYLSAVSTAEWERKGDIALSNG